MNHIEQSISQFLKLYFFSVYFIPAVRIFLDRQMSDIKGIYAVTFLAVSVEVCYVLLPILKQVYTN